MPYATSRARVATRRATLSYSVFPWVPTPSSPIHLASASWGLYEIDPGSLCFYFIDMKPYVNDCRFPNCTHDHEPGCAVRQAVEDGNVAPDRYDSYVRILNGESFQLDEW